MNEHKDTLKLEFEVSVEDIRFHSIRKGAATYVSSGSTCAPPQVATNIRAGWTMGAIQDTYLRYESAGDQYVGQVVSGSPLSSAKFGALPPQFDCQENANNVVSRMFSSISSHLNCVARYIHLVFYLQLVICKNI